MNADAPMVVLSETNMVSTSSGTDVIGKVIAECMLPSLGKDKAELPKCAPSDSNVSEDCPFVNSSPSVEVSVLWRL